MPPLGSSVTLFIREHTTIKETFANLFYRLFLGSETEQLNQVRQTVSKIVVGHEPNIEAKLKPQSLFVYLRQDPFKETVYISYKSFLITFAQILACFFLLKMIGHVIVYPIASGHLL